MYLATNSTNGKAYVGKTTKPFSVRQKEHLRRARERNRFYFHLALAKHGPENFSWKILAESDDNEDLIRLERKFIVELGTAHPAGYNLTLGGDGTLLSPEQRERKSQSVRAKWQANPERYEKARSVTANLTPEQKAAKAEKCRQRTMEQMSDPEKKAVFLGAQADRFEPLRKRKAAREFIAEVNRQIRKAHSETEKAKTAAASEYDRLVSRTERLRQDPSYQKAIHWSTARAVRCLDTGEVFPSATKAAEVLHLTRVNIVQCCRGTKSRIGGHRFAYVVPDPIESSPGNLENHGASSEQAPGHNPASNQLFLFPDL